MTDLAPLNHRSIRLPSARFNGVTGEQYITSSIGFARSVTPIAPGLEFAPDMQSRMYGYLKTGEHIFDAKLEFVGHPPPPVPEDEDYKPAINWTWMVPSFGLVTHTTNGSIARGAVVAVWEQYKQAPEAAIGMMPVIRVGQPVAVGANGRTFYAPNFQIVGWTRRDDIPAFRDRPAMCPLPSLVPERLAYAPVRPELAPPAGRNGRVPERVHDSRDDLNDAVPF